MGLMVLVLGLILFLGPHVLVTMRPQRAAVVKQLGERAYKGLFAALSIAGLYVTGKGFGMYDTAGPLVLWTAPAWTRHITEALMLPACIFVAAAYLPGSIKLALKHPMLVGVKTWAVAHLLVSGDVATVSAELRRLNRCMLTKIQSADEAERTKVPEVLEFM